METMHIKTGASMGVNWKNDGLGVNASTGFAVKKGMLFIYFHFQSNG